MENSNYKHNLCLKNWVSFNSLIILTRMVVIRNMTNYHTYSLQKLNQRITNSYWKNTKQPRKYTSQSVLCTYYMNVIYNITLINNVTSTTKKGFQNRILEYWMKFKLEKKIVQPFECRKKTKIFFVRFPWT